MIDFEKVLEEMSVEDFRKLDEFHRIAHEAIEAERVINQVYSPLVKKSHEPLQVYSYSAFDEYYGEAILSPDMLSQSFIWHYHDNWWGGRDWYVPCTKDGIYELFRNAYLEEMNKNTPKAKYVARSKPNTTTYETAVTYFKNFVKETMTKI